MYLVADHGLSSESVVGREPEPEVAKSTDGPVFELPPESKIRRAIQSFQVCHNSFSVFCVLTSLDGLFCVEGSV